MQVVDAHSMLCNLYISLREHQMQEFLHPFVVRTIFGTTEFDGCGQYLWVCPVGVAMVPDANPKKLEPMTISLASGFLE